MIKSYERRLLSNECRHYDIMLHIVNNIITFIKQLNAVNCDEKLKRTTQVQFPLINQQVVLERVGQRLMRMTKMINNGQVKVIVSYL